MLRGVYPLDTPMKRTWRPAIVAGVAVVALLGVAAAAVAAVAKGGSQPAVWVAPTQSPPGETQPPTKETAQEEDAVSLSATGDIVMGNAPGSLPSNGGKG